MHFHHATPLADSRYLATTRYRPTKMNGRRQHAVELGQITLFTGVADRVGVTWLLSDTSI